MKVEEKKDKLGTTMMYVSLIAASALMIWALASPFVVYPSYIPLWVQNYFPVEGAYLPHTQYYKQTPAACPPSGLAASCRPFENIIYLRYMGNWSNPYAGRFATFPLSSPNGGLVLSNQSFPEDPCLKGCFLGSGSPLSIIVTHNESLVFSTTNWDASNQWRYGLVVLVSNSTVTLFGSLSRSNYSSTHTATCDDINLFISDCVGQTSYIDFGYRCLSADLLSTGIDSAHPQLKPMWVYLNGNGEIVTATVSTFSTIVTLSGSKSP